MEVGGYHQKLLRINLSEKSSKIEHIDQKLLFNLLGGRGLGAWFLYQELAPKIDPLSEENKLVVMTGPLTGTTFPSAGRTSFTAKSPLTGTLFDSSLGGDFGAFLKKAGVDGVILEGKADSLTYIVIEDGKVEFKHAKDMQGMSPSETEAKLTERHGNKGYVSIGVAGENKVHMASIMSKTRTAGRGGLGAVMGSKNLKAIVAGGSKKIPIEHADAFRTLLDRMRKNIREDPLTGDDGSLARFGTNVLVHLVNSADMLPHRNFSKGNLDYEEVDTFSGETIREKYFQERSGCWACPVACGRIVKINDERLKGPEFESTVMLGPNASFFDYKDITELNRLCDEMGIDTIDVGNTLALAKEIGKIESLNDAKKLIRSIAANESIFAKGIKQAAQELGVSQKAMEVKGLSLPAYDPRGATGIALAYATSNRGGCHLRAYTIAPEILGNPEFVDPREKHGKPKFVKQMQDYHAVFDSAIICKYYQLALFDSLEFRLDDLARILAALTGLKWTHSHLYEVGSRIYTIERLFNAKEGFTREDDRLPEKFNVDLDPLLDQYYTERQWNESGTPRDYPSFDTVEKASTIEIPKSLLDTIEFPQIQVALDLDADIETIQSIAKEAYEGGARIIEAGTPALKRHGVDRLIPALRDIAPDALIVADLKTMDVGDLEARIAFRAGADIAAVLAIGSQIKIEEALSEAIRQDKMILIDFIDVPNPLQKMENLKETFAEEKDRIIFCLHRGISEQLKGRGIHEESELISKAREVANGFSLGVAGGLKEGVVGKIARHKPDVFIIGSAIYHASNPKEKVRNLLKEIHAQYPN